MLLGEARLAVLRMAPITEGAHLVNTVRIYIMMWKECTMCPRSFHFHGFQATPLRVSGKRNAGIYPALLVVLAYISKVDLKAIHSGRTCREVFALWQLGWIEI